MPRDLGTPRGQDNEALRAADTGWVPSQVEEQIQVIVRAR